MCEIYVYYCYHENMNTHNLTTNKPCVHCRPGPIDEGYRLFKFFFLAVQLSLYIRQQTKHNNDHKTKKQRYQISF